MCDSRRTMVRKQVRVALGTMESGQIRYDIFLGKLKLWGDGGVAKLSQLHDFIYFAFHGWEDHWRNSISSFAKVARKGKKRKEHA
jgi:hypothetical protein